MTKVPKFGFSAFLKIICANPKPQKTLIKNRHKPSEDPRDFHRSLRLRIQKIANGEMTVEQAILSVTAIKKLAERKSALSGINKFTEWRKAHPGPLTSCSPLTIESPGKSFKVSYSANFLLEIAGRKTAIHLWNTNVDLSRDLVIAMLTVVARHWPETTDRPDDFAVLSLKTGQIYRWSDQTLGHVKLGADLMLYIDKLCQISRKELGLPQVQERKEPPHPDRP